MLYNNYLINMGKLFFKLNYSNFINDILVNKNIFIITLKETLSINPLCQLFENTNILIEQILLTKVTHININNINSIFKREVLPSQLNKICLVNTPETLKSGLLLNLTCSTKCDKYGILYNPIVNITNTNLKYNVSFIKTYLINKNNINIQSLYKKKAYILNNYKNIVLHNNTLKLNTKKITKFFNPSFLTSYPSFFISFLYINDITRSLMANKHISQSTPLFLKEKPFTTHFNTFNLNLFNFNNIISPTEGIIIYVSNEVLKIQDIFNRIIIFNLFVTNNNVYYNLKPNV
eukprot:GHVU01191118.1.p1 GENE.GHVU01191118.1~~GHVU01191118.1.p1  ORF type:complete len:291 (-),score=17.23 GHVU01191118.1:2336-3208(-)